MQTKERYWEGLYWDGFSPESVGAIPVAQATSQQSDLKGLICTVRDLITKEKLEVKEYWVNIFLIKHIGERDQELGQEIKKQDCQKIDEIEKKEKIKERQGHPKESDEMIARLCHVNVFLGARASATADPGAKCLDLHFDAITLQYTGRTTCEYTDDYLDHLAPLCEFQPQQLEVLEGSEMMRDSVED